MTASQNPNPKELIVSIRGIAAVSMFLLLSIVTVHAGQSRIDAMPTGMITVDGREFEVRIARTPALRAAGFQHADPGRMAGEAIYFRYDSPRRPSFHMHNVPRPLLLAWIAPDGRVLRIIRMQPESHGHFAPQPVGAVLEYTEEHPLAARVRPGTRISRTGGD